MTDTTPQKLIDLYQQMYELTRPECDKCRAPRSCCSPEYCDLAEEVAAERGVQLIATKHPTLKFMGANGCIVPPHLRQLCTVHTCDIGNLGFKKHDAAWTKRYFQLRSEIDVLEMTLYGVP